MPRATTPDASQAVNALRFRRAFLLMLVVGISVLFLLVIGRFLIAVFLAAVLAGVSQPLHQWLIERFGGRAKLATTATLLVLLLGIVLPVAGFLTVVAAQAAQVVEAAPEWFREQSGRIGQLEALAERIPLVGRMLPEREQLLAQLEARLQAAAGRTPGVLWGALSTASRVTFAFVLQLFVMLYALFFFLLDGRQILRKMLGYTPLSPVEQVALLERFVSVTRATVKGSLLIGTLQGSLAGLAFWVAGVPAPAFWGAVMVVLSLIPAVGSGFVWVPAVIYLFIAGRTLPAIGLLLWCLLVVGTIDNVLRPRLVGRDARMSDLMILLSTLGGIVLFGAVGFVVGPIVAALFVTTWDIYGEAFKDWLPGEPQPLVSKSRPEGLETKQTGERVADIPEGMEDT
jgi:predicted PurR-regulated permease PerM